MKTAYFSTRCLHRKAGEVWRDLPEKDVWQKSEADPIDVLKIFHGIRIIRAESIRLSKQTEWEWLSLGYIRTHISRSQINVKASIILDHLKPYNVLLVMEVLEGDGSVISYISTSIFVREINA